MPSQDVQHDASRMNVVAEGFGTSGLDRIDPVSQHGAEDVDHLPVAT